MVHGIVLDQGSNLPLLHWQEDSIPPSNQGSPAKTIDWSWPDDDCSQEIKRHLLLGRKAMINLDSILKKRDITLPTKVGLVKAMAFFSSHVWMWELDYKESWAPMNWCFWTVMLEKTLKSPLDCKEIKPVNPKGNQPWIFIGRTDAEAETPIFSPPDEKNWLLGKDPDAGKDWRQEEKGMTED